MLTRAFTWHRCSDLKLATACPVNRDCLLWAALLTATPVSGCHMRWRDSYCNLLRR